MSILIKVGRLISTSDIAMAAKLNKIVSIDDITRGATPAALRQTRESISFIFHGEYYELSAA